MKSHKDFPITDQDQLLCVVIEMNPFTMPQNKMREKWHEVAMRVTCRICKGHDLDTEEQ